MPRHRRPVRPLVPLLALVALALAAPLAAQANSTIHGFSLGAHLLGTSLDPEDDLEDVGGGGGVDLAWGFQSGVAIFLRLSGAAMEPDEDKVGAEYVLAEADLGVRYSFRGEGARGRPFVEGAFSAMGATFEDVEWLDEEADVEVSGPAFSVGGGFEWFFSPSWSGTAGLRWSAGSFDEVTVGNLTIRLDEGDELDVRTTRLQLGVRHHFAGG